MADGLQAIERKTIRQHLTPRVKAEKASESALRATQNKATLQSWFMSLPKSPVGVAGRRNAHKNGAFSLNIRTPFSCLKSLTDDASDVVILH